VRNRLLLGFILFAVIATALLVVPLGLSLQNHEGSNTLKNLQHDTNALSVLLTEALTRNDMSRAIKLSDTYARSTGRPILVVDTAGVLIATKANQARDETLLRVASSTRKKELSGHTHGTSAEGPQYYVALRLRHVDNKVVAMGHPVLIVSAPVKVTAARIRSDWTKLALFGLLMLLIACCFGFMISNSLVRPLRRIGSAVEAIGGGTLDVQAPVDEGPPELRRLAETINATSYRLIGLLEAQRSFVADASHQLRTPLTALQLHLENLQRTESSSSAVSLNAVIAEMGRLSRLVDSLLTLARNEGRDPVLTTVDVGDAVIDRCEIWHPLAEEMELTLTAVALPTISGLLVADALEQILDNLLSNAFDATPAGGAISIEAFESGDTVEIHVIDSGPGLKESERSLALRRFWRSTDNSNEGSGLGLAIVEQLVRLSSGTIELRGATNGGIDATLIFRKA
jgi:signal transduction histidine kinase